MFKKLFSKKKPHDFDEPYDEEDDSGLEGLNQSESDPDMDALSEPEIGVEPKADTGTEATAEDFSSQILQAGAYHESDHARQLNEAAKNFKRTKAQKRQEKARKIKKEKHITDESKLSMGLGLVKRLIGDWPLTGAPPLTEKQFSQLFTARPAFVDYLPFVNYLPKYQVFQFDDEVSCGAAFELSAPDMDARSDAIIIDFCDSVKAALINLPVDEDAPYIVQIYAEDREPVNIATQLEKASKSEAKESAYSQAWYAEMREHFGMMANPHGIFADDRTDGSKGWRCIDRKLTLVIFRKADKAVWAKDKRRNSFVQFNRNIEMFVKALKDLKFFPKRMDDHDLYRWLTPWLNPNPTGSPYASVMDYLENHPLAEDTPGNRGAAWDLGQIICPEPPFTRTMDPIDIERGITRFGKQYSRFITFQPLNQAPIRGIIGRDRSMGGDNVIASMFDQMPAESIMCFTIIPHSTTSIKRKLEMIEEKTTKSREMQSSIALNQAKDGQQYLAAGTERIYYFQVGVYLRADDIETLDDRYFSAITQVNATKCMTPIYEEYDLFPNDSYIRNLPFVYSWGHDRKHALRACMAYTSHIAAVLPFYGRSRGSKNPCFINYNRSGEIVQFNPYTKADRSRVAHSVLFGPTGSGKSATQVAQAMQSMSVNRPRQFFIDKGGSFALVGDYYESKGLKVKRINFDPSKDVCFPPYAETKKALMQLRNQIVETDAVDDDDADEKRDYLAEMLYATELMITGGNTIQVNNLTQADRGFIQSALIAALEAAEANDQPHALPSDVMTQLTLIAEKQTLHEIILKITNMANSMRLWTEGTYGHFFNRYGMGFSDDDDVTIVELGVLTNKANAAMLAVAMVSIVSSITALGEKHQYSGRHIEFYQDEGHYVTRSPLLVDGFVEGVKVWRKINIWLNIATQNVDDFPDHAKKILDLIEFWWLLVMSPQEARKLEAMLDLSPETRELIKQCKKEPPYYVEGVILSEKFEDVLMRMVPPALCLALGMTDGDEKKALQELQDKLKCTRLEAAIAMSRQFVEKRKTFSPSYVEA